MKLSLSSLFKKSSGPKAPFKLVSYDALRDWKKVVYFTIVLFIASLLWSGYVFWSIQANPGPEIDNFQSRKNLLNTALLRSLGDVYGTKSEKFQSLVDSAPLVVDPAK